MDHKEILSRLYCISDILYLPHSCRFSCHFYYSCFFQWPAVRQFSRLQITTASAGQLAWQRWSQTTAFCWVGRNKISPQISVKIELGDCVLLLIISRCSFHTGSPGVECRNTEFFYWGVKRKIKALGTRNLKCSLSSGSPGDSEGESSSDTIEKERQQMVKMLTSDLRISFWESHCPPLLVSASSTPAFLFFFTMSLKAHNPRLSSSNILNFKTL